MKTLKQILLLTFGMQLAMSVVAQSKEKIPEDSAAWTTANLIAYRNEFRNNLPKPVGYVNDFEGLYSSNELRTLDSIIRDFEDRTTIQMAIITFDSLMLSKDSLDALTLKIANYWGVGQRGKNNGIVIGICRGHRKMRIQNGYGIEKILTDAETKQIIDSAFIPYFKEGRYFDGTLNGLLGLIAGLEER